FFAKLRGLAVTLEKEVKQLEQALNGEDADYEEKSPLSVLQDLHCEVKTLKEHVNGSLGKSCSEKQAVREFMKASEILMQRNAADLGKLRELFQKYGYKPPAKDSAVFVQNKSDEEKASDVLHLPACTEKPPLPKDPLRNPQLSDFGLSQYAFSRPWSADKTQHTTNALQQKPRNETLPRVQTPCALPKTPKCKLKMDDYECVTPKLEHFGISERTMCMNEDYTMSLIHKTTQTINKLNPLQVFSCTDCSARHCHGIHLMCPSFDCTTIRVFHTRCIYKGKMHRCLWSFAFHDHGFVSGDALLMKKDDNEGNVPEMTAREVIVTSVPKSDVRAENADWMASPMVFVFRAPDVKVSSDSSTVLSRSPETKKLPLPSHIATPQYPDFQTRWLKAEAKVVKSSLWEKIESMTRNDAKDKHYKEDKIPFSVSPDEYLKHLGDPSPPTIKQYDQLLDTPPPPEITRIPDDVLQILCKYNHKGDSSKAKEVETKTGNTTRYESHPTDYCNKENRYDCILQIWL
ncbi:SKA3 protein, partial [Smithornis capensis]|nr:SKA3 protein [Smithornis capensis]